MHFAQLTGLVKNRPGQLQLKSEYELGLELFAPRDLYYIEFLPEGVQRPQYVKDFPSTPEHHALLEKLKDLTVTACCP